MKVWEFRSKKRRIHQVGAMVCICACLVQNSSADCTMVTTITCTTKLAIVIAISVQLSKSQPLGNGTLEAARKQAQAAADLAAQAPEKAAEIQQVNTPPLLPVYLLTPDQSLKHKLQSKVPTAVWSWLAEGERGGGPSFGR